MSESGLKFKEAITIAVATLVLFAVIEGVFRVIYLVRNATVESIPLPYVIGHDFGPVPPWLDGLRVLERDDDLIWKSRPNLRRRYIDIFSPADSEADRASMLRQFVPSIPEAFKFNPIWEISLNSRGFRDTEFPVKKPPTTFRIICLGDSWTFGANVGQDQAYPQQVGALLDMEYGDTSFEVLNLGVLGYSSFQGLEQLKQQVTDLQPDLLLIGFGMNDASFKGYRDKDIPVSRKRETLVEKILEFSAINLESYKIVKYWIDLARFSPASIGNHLEKQGRSSGRKTAESLRQQYEDNEPWVAVSPSDYRKNFQEIIKLARANQIGIILLNNLLVLDDPYKDILDDISKTEGVPLIDSSWLIYQARKKYEQGIETKLGLEPQKTFTNGAVSSNNEVVFRVYTGNRPVPETLYIAGPYSQLGDSIPNRVRMYDDGTHGDQVAGDKVWSFTASLPPETEIAYLYTNSGQEGKWEGLDVPHIRTVRTGTQPGKFYAPIDTFGKIYMQADSWHTNAAGYELIANAVFESLKKDENFDRYVSNQERPVGQ